MDATVRETVNAAKDRIGADSLEELFDGAAKLIVSKGKKFQVYDLKKEPMDGEGLSAVALGPTGNLRAPTIQKGKTFFVGFNEEAYEAHF